MNSIQAFFSIFDIFKISPSTPNSSVNSGEKHDGLIGELVGVIVLELGTNFRSTLPPESQKIMLAQF